MGKYFGTDGVRGRFDATLMTPIANKIALFLAEYPEGKKNKILIGQDPRFSSPLILESLCEGFLARGATVINLSYTTTPSISYLLATVKDIDFGIMISASHNPYLDNGIKIFNRNGEKINEDLEAEIEHFIDHPTQLKIENNGRLIEGQSYTNQYIDFVAGQSRLKNPQGKILIDCANGSVSYVIENLIKKLGIQADFIHHQPDGKNINDQCGATHLDSLKTSMLNKDYLLGVAFDGDGDRMIAVLPSGFVIDGDAQIFLHAMRMQKLNTLNHNQVVLTVMSNLGLKVSLKKLGIDVIEVPVGDRHVQQGLKKHQLNLGGEQSGHVMFYDVLNTGSGLLSMVYLLNELFIDQGITLENTLKKLEIYPQYLKNIPVVNKVKIMNHPALISGVKTIENQLVNEGRILVRASGTESLVRVMVEAKTMQVCEDSVNEIVALIHQIELQGE